MIILGSLDKSFLGLL